MQKIRYEDVMTYGLAQERFDGLLAAYGAGTLSPAPSMLVACHLEISGRNRSFVSALETLGGSMLAESECAELDDRASALDRIFSADASDSEDHTIDQAGDSPFPPSLRRILGSDASAIQWRSRLPGLKDYALNTNDNAEVSLMWIKAGQAMPSHTHAGTELTLVLSGGFSDELGHYVRGDVSVADASVNHRPIADEGEDCICLAVLDAPIRLTGPIGRFIEPFISR